MSRGLDHSSPSDHHFTLLPASPGAATYLLHLPGPSRNQLEARGLNPSRLTQAQASISQVASLRALSLTCNWTVIYSCFFPVSTVFSASFTRTQTPWKQQLYFLHCSIPYPGRGPGTGNRDERREKWEGEKKERNKKGKFFQKKEENAAERGRYLSDKATRVKHNICALI